LPFFQMLEPPGKKLVIMRNHKHCFFRLGALNTNLARVACVLGRMGCGNAFFFFSFNTGGN
jgi:hypothetical protein